MIVGQGPIALAVGAGGVCVDWTFLLSSILSLLFIPFPGRRLDIGWNTQILECLKGRLPHRK